MKRHLNIKTLKTCIAALGLGLGILVLAIAPVVRAEPIASKDATLAELFAELSQARSLVEAEIITPRIWQIWITNNDDADNLALMQHGISYMNSGNYTGAEEIFSRIIRRDPSFAEAWNKRATVRYILQDMRGSEHDIHKVLEREPRHFGALSGLGMIRLQEGLFEDALVIYRYILKINPNSPDAIRLIPELESRLKGDPA